MTVSELIRQLGNCPLDDEVSVDVDGDGFSVTCDGSNGDGTTTLRVLA